MGTEVFPRGVEHLTTTEVGYLTGGGKWPRTFVWMVHPEEGARRISEAGGAQDAWGRDYSTDEFVQMLRDRVDRQALHDSLTRGTGNGGQAT